MTEPLEDTDQQEKEELIKKAKDMLKSAQEILEDPECKDDMSFHEFLKKICVEEEHYFKYKL